MIIIRRILKLIFGFFLLPAVIFAVVNFCREIADIPVLSPMQAMFFYGVALYIGIHIFVHRPDFLYVLGHESTHAVTAGIFGGKIFDFRVSSRGGRIKTDRDNTIISLMPYFVPFYTVIVCCIWAVFAFFKDVKAYNGYFVFALGMSLAFHLVQTAEFLRLRQTDVLRSGYVFSMPLIILVNIAITAGILSFLFLEFSFKQMATITFYQARDFYVNAWEYVSGFLP